MSRTPILAEPFPLKQCQYCEREVERPCSHLADAGRCIESRAQVHEAARRVREALAEPFEATDGTFASPDAAKDDLVFTSPRPVALRVGDTAKVFLGGREMTATIESLPELEHKGPLTVVELLESQIRGLRRQLRVIEDENRRLKRELRDAKEGR